jgi:hypothetical protein
MNITIGITCAEAHQKTLSEDRVLTSGDMVNVLLNLSDFALRFTQPSFERLGVAFFTLRLVFPATLSFRGAMDMGRFHQALFKR